jgi:hypothetical protein
MTNKAAGSIHAGDDSSLGIEGVESASDVDFKLCEGYTAYSAELLRISLLILSGLAALWMKASTPFPATRSFQFAVIGAAASLVLSAFAALCHRFTAMDSMAYHVAALRLRARGLPARPTEGGQKARLSDLQQAHLEEKARDWRFKASGLLLTASAFLLLLGVSFSLRAMWLIRQP